MGHAKFRCLCAVLCILASGLLGASEMRCLKNLRFAGAFNQGTVEVDSAGRLYAIRRPLGDTTADILSLRYQAKVLARLNPENTLDFLPRSEGMVPVEGGVNGLKTEFVLGQDMDAYLQKRVAKMPPRERLKGAIDALLKMALVTDKLHHLGAVHADLKPNQIILEQRTGRLVFIDFETTVVDDGKGNRLVPPNEIATPQVAAPEVRLAAKRSAASSESADFYSLAQSTLLLSKVKRHSFSRFFRLSDPLYDKAWDEFAALLKRLTAEHPADRPRDPVTEIAKARENIVAIFKTSAQFDPALEPLPRQL